MTNELVFTEATDAGGTSYRGMFESPYGFEETIARLKALSGQDPADGASADGKTSFEFMGTFKGAVFTIYDYKCDRSFHIGGHGGGWLEGKTALNVAGLQEALAEALRTVAPHAYAAPETYDGQPVTHGWPVR